MPGIVGFTHTNEAAETAQKTLAAMGNLLRHHETLVQDPLFTDSAIGCTRVHTGRISDDVQPVEEQGVRVWLEGYFCNQDELGVTESLSDPAILAKLYREAEDLTFLRKLNGEFAAVIYDTNRRRIHLITDRFGLKYLYWTIHNGELAWAAEYKAFLALPGFQPQVYLLDYWHHRGFFSDNNTWFEGVELMPWGYVFTWDIATQTLHKEAYWTWDDIPVFPNGMTEVDLIHELSRRFRRAVERRCSSDLRLATLLSGGLDSRAILAGLDGCVDHMTAITYGQSGCDETTAARKVVAQSPEKIAHYVHELNAGNWLLPRIKPVWALDGESTFDHLHQAPALAQLAGEVDVLLDGNNGGGIWGGNYMYKYNSKPREIEAINNGTRRLVNSYRKANEVFVAVREPFFDNDLMDLVMAIPRRLRNQKYIYRKTLLTAFPKYFQSVPYGNTGLPISWPWIVNRVAYRANEARKQLLGKWAQYQGKSYNDLAAILDEDVWLRQEPARTFVDRLLRDSRAVYPDYIPRDEVIAIWDAHLGGVNNRRPLRKFITMEIWLRMVFDADLRQRWLAEDYAGFV